MNDNDRITIRISHITTIEFYRGKPRTYRIRPADLPRLHHIFNYYAWPAFTHIEPTGLVVMEFQVSDRELPDKKETPCLSLYNIFNERFYTVNEEPQPERTDAEVDYNETMDDFVESTRS